MMITSPIHPPRSVLFVAKAHFNYGTAHLGTSPESSTQAHFDSESSCKPARVSANHHVEQTCSSTSLACIGVRLHDWSVLHRSRQASSRNYHTDHAHTSDVEKYAREPSTRQEPKDHRPPRPEFTVILHRGSARPTQSAHGELAAW